MSPHSRNIERKATLVLLRLITNHKTSHIQTTP